MTTSINHVWANGILRSRAQKIVKKTFMCECFNVYSITDQVYYAHWYWKSSQKIGRLLINNREYHITTNM